MTISSWLNFGRPRPPARGSVAGRIFLAPPYYSQRAVFESLWALFHLCLSQVYTAHLKQVSNYPVPVRAGYVFRNPVLFRSQELEFLIIRYIPKPPYGTVLQNGGVHLSVQPTQAHRTRTKAYRNFNHSVLSYCSGYWHQRYKSYKAPYHHH